MESNQKEKLVHMSLHQDELGLIYDLCNYILANAASETPYVKAVLRLRKRIKRNFTAESFTLEDKRHYVHYVNAQPKKSTMPPLTNEMMPYIPQGEQPWCIKRKAKETKKRKKILRQIAEENKASSK